MSLITWASVRQLHFMHMQYTYDHWELGFMLINVLADAQSHLDVKQGSVTAL